MDNDLTLLLIGNTKELYNEKIHHNSQITIAQNISLRSYLSSSVTLYTYKSCKNWVSHCTFRCLVSSSLRYGDHQEYCTEVTRERCLTEVRVFEDCCKTCEGLVAPPGVCIDTVPNCPSLIANPASCYTDLIYCKCQAYIQLY